MTTMTRNDVPKIIEWLGASGARAGLHASERLTLSELRQLARECDVPISEKAKRDEIINLMILQFDHRITKSVAEMKAMSAADLADFLNRTGCSKEELQALLYDLCIPFKKSDSRLALVRHAADQIAGLGVYQRIAGRAPESTS
jgi:hypothetical protein